MTYIAYALVGFMLVTMGTLFGWVIAEIIFDCLQERRLDKIRHPPKRR